MPPIENKEKVGMGVISNPNLGLFSCGSETGNWTIHIKISDKKTIKVYTYFEKDGVYYANSITNTTESPNYRLNPSTKFWEPILKDLVLDQE